MSLVLHRQATAAESLGLRPKTAAHVRWWPFLLNTDVPAGGVDRHSYLCRKYGSESRLKRMQAVIVEVGKTVGIDFAFDRIRRTPNTLNAHRLIRFAEARGRGEPMLEAIFEAYFVEGETLAIPPLSPTLVRKWASTSRSCVASLPRPQSGKAFW